MNTITKIAIVAAACLAAMSSVVVHGQQGHTATPWMTPIALEHDHSVIAADAVRADDAQTVAASIAAYER